MPCTGQSRPSSAADPHRRCGSRRACSRFQRPTLSGQATQHTAGWTPLPPADVPGLKTHHMEGFRMVGKALLMGRRYHKEMKTQEITMDMATKAKVEALYNCGNECLPAQTPQQPLLSPTAGWKDWMLAYLDLV